jgi:hypothetical protein
MVVPDSCRTDSASDCYLSGFSVPLDDKRTNCFCRRDSLPWEIDVFSNRLVYAYVAPLLGQKFMRRHCKNKQYTCYKRSSRDGKAVKSIYGLVEPAVHMDCEESIIRSRYIAFL